jgi:hypothetical protein
MRATIVTLSILTLIFILSQAFVINSTKNIEMHEYDVIKQFDQFEIRKYRPANFSSIKIDANTYKESSGKGFRTLAGYIFGGNDENKKIAMTSPVEMDLEDSVTMKFMIPVEHEIEDLPKPNDANIRFSTEPEKIVAAIRFGGWANDTKIEKYKNQLVQLLQENNIAFKNKFSFFGYNPPYEVVNRRNEIIVELEKNAIDGI